MRRELTDSQRRLITAWVDLLERYTAVHRRVLDAGAWTEGDDLAHQELEHELFLNEEFRDIALDALGCECASVRDGRV